MSIHLAGAVVTLFCAARATTTQQAVTSLRSDFADEATGAVVRDLRAPSDTGRLVHDRAVSLRGRPAQAARARQVWAPFGIAQPETTR